MPPGGMPDGPATYSLRARRCNTDAAEISRRAFGCADASPRPPLAAPLRPARPYGPAAPLAPRPCPRPGNYAQGISPTALVSVTAAGRKIQGPNDRDFSPRGMRVRYLAAVCVRGRGK